MTFFPKMTTSKRSNESTVRNTSAPFTTSRGIDTVTKPAPATASQPTKGEVIAALRKHIAQRSGIDPRNYDTRANMMGDYRPMLRDGAIARDMLDAIEWRDSITAEHLLEGFRAFMGRLSYNPETKECEYCTGQYFVTEYRRAAVVVLAQVLWDYIKRDTSDLGAKGWRERFERNVRIAFPRRIASRILAQ